jgi:ADP-heptose:LPS heptosyltransferase
MKKIFPNKKNILLVNITRLGDMIQATPTIAGLKKENPDCKITVVVEKGFAEVCRYIPYIDEIFPIDLPLMVTAIAREGEGIIDAYEYLDSVINELKGKNFDYCVNMSNSAYTALLIKSLEIDRIGGWVSDSEGYRLIESEWARLFATNVYHRNRFYNSLNLVDIFRCSADVDSHPRKLLLNFPTEALEYVEEEFLTPLGGISEFPLIAVQAGASQAKRQWSTDKFVELIRRLRENLSATIFLTGTAKELEIIDPIKAFFPEKEVVVVAGKTSIAQLAALLSKCSATVTGDTGTMHISVAVNTPVVALFLASAYAYETGPYSAGNIIIQPIIGCGPCNPNKLCSRPDCHDLVPPKVVADLTTSLITDKSKKEGFSTADSNSYDVFISRFDEYGFIDLVQINNKGREGEFKYKELYRRLWLHDLGGLKYSNLAKRTLFSTNGKRKLIDSCQEGSLNLGLEKIKRLVAQGLHSLAELEDSIVNVNVTAKDIAKIGTALQNSEKSIEDFGYEHSVFGPLTRMFTFGRENLKGSDISILASQMRKVYDDLKRRVELFEYYYQEVTKQGNCDFREDKNFLTNGDIENATTFY